MHGSGPAAAGTGVGRPLLCQKRLHPLLFQQVQIVQHAHAVFQAIALVQPFQPGAGVLGTREAEPGLLAAQPDGTFAAGRAGDVLPAAGADDALALKGLA